MQGARRRTAAATGIGLLRIAVGAALAGAPGSFQRWELVPPPVGSSTGLLTRTVGIRDIAIGVGTVVASRSGPGADLRRWVGVGLLSDVLDVVAAASSARLTGKRGVAAALIPIPVIVADLWVLSTLNATRTVCEQPPATAQITP